MTLYDKRDLRFHYPENWAIREEELDAWPRSVMVESPSGAFWSLHVYPDLQDSQQRVEEVTEAMRAEYDSLEVSPPVIGEMLETAVDDEIAGQDMAFYCLDFLVLAHLRCFHAQGRTYVTLSQAEDREFQELADVFQAITIGMLRELHAT